MQQRPTTWDKPNAESLNVRIQQHNNTDKKSHLLRHANNSKHHRVWLDDFKIIEKGYKSNFKQQISERKPDL